MLKIFGFFHLNIMFSSIEEERRLEVFNSCYKPLLDFIEVERIPFGIELSGITLEEINKIDHTWIYKLVDLEKKGLLEIIGSGYSQLIGPLVPEKVNKKNLLLGIDVYEKFLGFNPQTYLINEQAFSLGLIDTYLDLGIKDCIMEWNNPYSANPLWDEEMKYHHQFVKGSNSQYLGIIWNDTIAFQKFQKYVHGEINLDEYIEFIVSKNSSSDRNFCIYGSDIEVINFRPKRFNTESILESNNEWSRIIDLFKSLRKLKGYNFILPAETALGKNSSTPQTTISLTNARDPVIVKKQPKYNITRWAVTGRDDLTINSRCWKIYESITSNQELNNTKNWKELCYLWSSDFRTHITENRWKSYLERLAEFEEKITIISEFNTSSALLDESINSFEGTLEDISKKLGNDVSIYQENNLIIFNGKNLKVTFNYKKGMSIESFIDHNISAKPLFGTLRNDYFNDIAWNVDLFSGHLIFDLPGKHKITDIHHEIPKVTLKNHMIKIENNFHVVGGKLKKEMIIDDENSKLFITYILSLDSVSNGSLRYGFITLIPESFNISELKYISHNGGKDSEAFHLNIGNIDHGNSVSKLVSSHNCIGMTEGYLSIGDSDKCIEISIDKSKNASVAMLHQHEVMGKRFIRTYLSAQEIDDTSRPRLMNNLQLGMTIKASLLK